MTNADTATSLQKYVTHYKVPPSPPNQATRLVRSWLLNEANSTLHLLAGKVQNEWVQDHEEELHIWFIVNKPPTGVKSYIAVDWARIVHMLMYVQL